MTIFYKKKKYKICFNCDYLNDFKATRCNVCGNENLNEFEKKYTKKWLFCFGTIFFIVFTFFLYYKIDNRKIKWKDTDRIPVFVSEKIMINYYTYLISLRNMRCIKPDEHDVKVIKKAMNLNDIYISSIAINTYNLWEKRGFIK